LYVNNDVLYVKGKAFIGGEYNIARSAKTDANAALQMVMELQGIQCDTVN
jgi:hypothetical protein